MCVSSVSKAYTPQWFDKGGPWPIENIQRITLLKRQRLNPIKLGFGQASLSVLGIGGEVSASTLPKLENAAKFVGMGRLAAIHAFE